jgi:ATP phosphoribosyltransferase
LVETGETLRQNGLVPLEKIADISSVVIANRAALKLRREAIEPVLDALRA